MHSGKLNSRSSKRSTPVFLVLFLFQSFVVFSQPLPCTDPPTMTSFCKDACIICDIDGYTGRNGTGGTGEAPPGFCTTFLHNAKWIAFIAGSTDLKIRMTVTNCTQWRGLELGIYEGIDCKNYKLVSNCKGGANQAVAENTAAIFQNTVPLTIGQYYYLVMDGSNGSVCDWTFDVIEGSTKVPELTTSGVISGPEFTCANGSDIFTTSGQVGATIFDWTLNGTDLGNGQDIEVNWTQPGTYQVCVTASNACDVAPPSCKTIVVRNIPETAISATICEGSTYIVDEDNSLEAAGEYDFVYTNQFGCDSIVHISLAETTVSIANISANICDGDSLYIGNTPFYEAGQFTEMIPAASGCDSIVNLDLSLIICEINGTSDHQPVKCFGEKTGSLTFSIKDGTPPFDYTWKKINSNDNGTGTLSNINLDETINGLSAGTYLITVGDQFGNDAVIIGTVTQPQLLTGNDIVSEYNSYNISCNGGADGAVEIIMSGGSLPYNYTWHNGEKDQTITGLSAGNYSVTINDVNDCPLIISGNLSEPLALQMEPGLNDPTCEGLNTGSIEITSASGGTSPYLFRLDDQNYSTELIYSDLLEGSHVLTLQDANGCELETILTLTGAIIPELEIGSDATIKLSEDIQLTASSNIPLDNIIWNPPTGLSCTNCPEPIARPFLQTIYIASVTSVDGCITSDSLTIRVDESRRVFVPNVFSPNNDGINDLFSIDAGPEVSRILSLRVYSRWGAMVFQDLEYDPNIEDRGWDGSYRGALMDNGVFAWTANVEFLDGVTMLLKGDVTLVR